MQAIITLISLRKEQLEKMIRHLPGCDLITYALKQMDSLAESTRNDTFCHNDLNPNNLLASPDKIFFIDWECSGVNDAFLDLAAVATTLRLSEDKSSELLVQYLGQKPSKADQEHFYLMKRIALFRCAISFAANIKNANNVRNMNTETIPKFNEYNPQTHGKIDKSSDQGRLYICLMLIKQAMASTNRLSAAPLLLQNAQNVPQQLAPRSFQARQITPPLTTHNLTVDQQIDLNRFLK